MGTLVTIDSCPEGARLFGEGDAEVRAHVARCARCRRARQVGYERTLQTATCAEIEPLLAARIVGALTEEQASALAAHVGGCATCLALATDLHANPVAEALVDEGVIDPDDFPELRVVEP